MKTDTFISSWKLLWPLGGGSCKVWLTSRLRQLKKLNWSFYNNGRVWKKRKKMWYWAHKEFGDTIWLCGLLPKFYGNHRTLAKTSPTFWCCRDIWTFRLIWNPREKSTKPRRPQYIIFSWRSFLKQQIYLTLNLTRSGSLHQALLIDGIWYSSSRRAL